MWVEHIWMQTREQYVRVYFFLLLNGAHGSNSNYYLACTHRENSSALKTISYIKIKYLTKPL